MDKDFIITSIINIIDLKDRNASSMFDTKELSIALREYLLIKVNNENAINDLFEKHGELINKVSNMDTSLTIEDYNSFLEKLRTLKRKYLMNN